MYKNKKDFPLDTVAFENLSNNAGMTLACYSNVIKRRMCTNDLEEIVGGIYSYLLKDFSEKYKVSVPRPIWGSKTSEEGNVDYFEFYAQEIGDYEGIGGELVDYEVDRVECIISLVNDILTIDSTLRLPLDKMTSSQTTPKIKDNFYEQTKVFEDFHNNYLGVNLTNIGFYNKRKKKALNQLTIGDERSDRIFSVVEQKVFGTKVKIKKKHPAWFKGIVENK